MGRPVKVGMQVACCKTPKYYCWMNRLPNLDPTPHSGLNKNAERKWHAQGTARNDYFHQQPRFKQVVTDCFKRIVADGEGDYIKDLQHTNEGYMMRELGRLFQSIGRTMICTL